MPNVPAPGTVKLAFSGTAGPDVWAVIWHTAVLGNEASITQTTLASLASTAFAAWGTHFMALTTSNWVLDQVLAVDLTSPTSLEASATGATPGSRGGSVAANSVSMVLSYAINYKRRGGHPRSYMPPGSNGDLLDSAHWTATFQGLFQPAWSAFWAQINTVVPPIGGNPWEQVIPLYTYTYTDNPTKKKYTSQRTGYIGSYFVQGNPVARAAVGSQRRRLRSG